MSTDDTKSLTPHVSEREPQPGTETGTGTERDSLELTSLSPTDPDPSDAQHHTRRTTTWGSAKTWYLRTVLRSGKGYDRLPERKAPPNPNHLHGWRFGAMISCVAVGICLCINVVVTIVLGKLFPSAGSGLVVLMEEDCNDVKATDSKVHYALNMIATLLVCASNYNMQCLTALTRKEVDVAHGRGKWLDIGVHSLRNLSCVGRAKTMLWVGLLVSSMPLHLLWNSAVFMTTTFNDYSGLVVTREFVDGEASIGIDCAEEAMKTYRSGDQRRYVTCWLHGLAQEGQRNMTQMGGKECMAAYESGIQGQMFNVVTVVKHADGVEQSTTFAPPDNVTLPVVAYFHPLDYPRQVQDWCEGFCQNWASGNEQPAYCFDAGWDNSTVPEACQQHMVNGTDWAPDGLSQSNYWMCDTDTILLGECNGNTAQTKADSWRILPEGYEIDSCFTTRAEHSCQLQYSPLILYIAIACNAVKFVCILLCLLVSRESVLTTVGDALDSFLTRPEPLSEGRCLLSKQDESLVPEEHHKHGHQVIAYPPQPWVHGADWIERWYQGSSLKRWGACILLWLACIIVGIIFLDKGIKSVGSANIFSMGFGALSMNAIVNISDYQGGTTASVLSTSLIANLPQLLLSGLYFMYNAVLTGMTSAYEWSRFAYKKTSLRVTVPAGSQRETYWLQLPWRYSLPMVICSVAFHWLISQSIFLINLRIYQPNNELLTQPNGHFPSASPSGVVTACGYSPLAIVCALGVGAVMFLALVYLSSRRLKTDIPVVGSCSFAISAACHPPESDTEAALEPLLWGAVRHQEGDRPGHCCLTSLAVEKPRQGDLYG